jgi:hypothetical protein
MASAGVATPADETLRVVKLLKERIGASLCTWSLLAEGARTESEAIGKRSASEKVQVSVRPSSALHPDTWPAVFGALHRIASFRCREIYASLATRPARLQLQQDFSCWVRHPDAGRHCSVGSTRHAARSVGPHDDGLGFHWLAGTINDAGHGDVEAVQ